MTPAPKRSLLDELRAKSEAVRERDAAAHPPIEKLRQQIDGCLWRTFRWLEEAVGHLDVIRPTVARAFRLPDVLTLDRPQFDGGFVSFRRRGLGVQEEIDQVELFYRLTGTEPFVLRVPPGAAAFIAERLRTSTMPYELDTEQDDRKVARSSVFRIQPSIAATVCFAADYALHAVEVTLSNVDRFESVRLQFHPDAIDETALEDLVRFMLGESNGFLHRAPLALIRPRHEAADPPAGPG
jgi:hypothetical protein